MLDKAKRRKFKHHRRPKWSPYALSNRLHQTNKSQDSADDRLKDYQETTAVIGNNRPHRANKKEKRDRWFRDWWYWSCE